MKLLIQPSYFIRKMQIFDEVFLKVNKSTMNMLHRSHGYVPYESDLLHLGFLWAMICYILLLTYESDDRLWGSLGLSAWKISFTRSWLLDLMLRGPATSYGHRSWRHHWGFEEEEESLYVEGGIAGNRENYIDDFIRRMN